MPKIDLITLLELVGHLNDDSASGSASARFRNYLQNNVQYAEDVRAYVSDSLSQSGEQFNKALQDIINHLGQLLGFDVLYGRYRGVKGEIGFDGLWRSPTGLSIVVEAKTTDVYTVKTATLLGYINSLVSEGKIPNPEDSLGLYVYGRFDAGTNQLENAIIVEGRRERLRVVSVEALLHLLELKQEYNLAHKTILGLLLPAPVKVDALVNLIFDIVAQEKEEVEETTIEAEQTVEEPVEVIDYPHKNVSKKTSSNLISIDESYTARTVTSILLFQNQYEVHTWKDAALKVFEVLRKQNPKKFEDVASTIYGRKRPYITADKDKLRKSENIPQTSLHFETNLSANSMVQLCYTLLVKWGYSKTDLQFETEE